MVTTADFMRAYTAVNNSGQNNNILFDYHSLQITYIKTALNIYFLTKCIDKYINVY